MSLVLGIGVNKKDQVPAFIQLIFHHGAFWTQFIFLLKIQNQYDITCKISLLGVA